jgi:nitrate/nitrite transport system substrate-binding protein
MVVATGPAGKPAARLTPGVVSIGMDLSPLDRNEASSTSRLRNTNETAVAHALHTFAVMQRRDFLRLSGAGALAAGLGSVAAGCGEATTQAGTGMSPDASRRPVRLGFIALTDAASAIMASELGYFAERDLEVTLAKQASWPALRDALLNGELDCAHCLFSMPFSIAAGIGGAGGTELKIAMIISNNGQGITLANEYRDVEYGDIDAFGALVRSKNAPQFGMTFPGGTHDLWLRYLLRAAGAEADRLKISPIPPPQMVQNMATGTISGFSVGEPWNAVAVAQDIGFTFLATQDLWLHHPEKALVANTRFAEEQSETLTDVVSAMLDASRWLDDPANRAEAAAKIASERYVNAPVEIIRDRLTGTYDLGAGNGRRSFEDNQMQFFRDGATNFPRRSYGVWVLTQYQRLGLVADVPDIDTTVEEILLQDLYAAAAERAKVSVPDDDLAPFEVQLDGAMFDPTRREEELRRP